MMHVSHTAGSFQSPYSSNKFKNIQNFTGGFCVNGASSKQGGFCVCGACVRVSPDSTSWFQKIDAPSLTYLANALNRFKLKKESTLKLYTGKSV
jgi:hypothetical protein